MSDQARSDYTEMQELLDHLEGLLRQDAFTDDTGRTSSGALSEHADGLRLLAKHGRLRIATERGPRIVTGFWPERDPWKGQAR